MRWSDVRRLGSFLQLAGEPWFAHLRGYGRAVAALVLVAAASTACGVESRVDRAISVIENASNDVLSAQRDWKQVLLDLQRELPEEVQSTVRNEVDGVVQRAITGAEQATFCTVDFLRQRASQSLRRIAEKLRGAQPAPLLPHICKVIPNSINGYLSPERRYQVDISGYDLTKDGPNGLRLAIVSAGSARQDVSSHLSIVSPYEATINLGRTGVKTEARSKSLEVRVADRTLSTITFIQPQPPPPFTREVELGIIDFEPPHVGSGDREFKDHGPCVTTKAELRQAGNQLQVRGFMDAYECHGNMRSQSDHTRARGWSPWQNAEVLDPDLRIVRILSPTRSTAPKYRDTNHSEKTVEMAAGDLVLRYITVGDTPGNDVRDGTRLRVVFRPARVMVQKRTPDPWSESQFRAHKNEEIRRILRTQSSVVGESRLRRRLENPD